MNRLARASSIFTALVVLAHSAPALAGGYDTPMLYSARHMGMGGAAIGWVNDPSALYHNPAGLGHVRGLSLLGDFSPLIGTITASPQARPETTSIESDTTFAPFFLVGAAYGITDWLTVGLAVYPVASAGATYEYDLGSGTITDHTKLVFIEVSPGFALQLPHGIRVGAGYRINSVSLDRTRETPDGMELDLPLSGMNFFSFRAGVQWQPIPELEIGLTYRHKTITDVSADTAKVPISGFVADATDVTSDFTLPTKLGFGARGNFGALHTALDLEYGLNSENHTNCEGANGYDENESERNCIRGTLAALGEVPVGNYFEWTDALTLRVGVEYRLMDDKIATRLGYIFDAKTSNEHYPSAFGTPPGPTHVLTIGGGYDAGPWQVNLAYAYRFGTAEVTQEDIDGATETCLFCSAPGDYAIGLHGIYVDFSVDLFPPDNRPPPEDPNANLVQPEPAISAPPSDAPADTGDAAPPPSFDDAGSSGDDGSSGDSGDESPTL